MFHFGLYNVHSERSGKVKAQANSAPVPHVLLRGLLELQRVCLLRILCFSSFNAHFVASSFFSWAVFRVILFFPLRLGSSLHLGKEALIRAI